MSRRGPLLMVLASVAAAGLILGAALVEEPEVVIPLTLEALVLLVVTGVLVRGAAAGEERAFLTRVVAAGGALRLAAVGFVYGVVSPGIFAPDAASYLVRGRSLFQFWNGGPRPALADRWQSGYEILNGLGYFLFEDPELALAVVNLFASLWTVVLTYRLAARCFGPDGARVAAVLVALFPSLVLWSVLNIRESLTTLLVTASMLQAVRLVDRPSGADALLLGLWIVLLSTLRDYMAVLLMGGLAIGLVAAARSGRWLSTLVGGTVVALVGIFALESSGVLTQEVVASPLATAAELRSSLQGDFRGGLAGSAFGTGYDTSTIGGALRYLPLGLAYFLFAPFPWAVESTLQALTLPEVLLWYLLVPWTVMGLARIGRREHAAAPVIAAVLLLAVTSYALVEGNFGTAYRHRAQVMPLFFIFTASGFGVWWARVKKRRQARFERVQAARSLQASGGSKGS